MIHSYIFCIHTYIYIYIYICLFSLSIEFHLALVCGVKLL